MDIIVCFMDENVCVMDEKLRTSVFMDENVCFMEELVCLSMRNTDLWMKFAAQGQPGAGPGDRAGPEPDRSVGT